MKHIIRNSYWKRFLFFANWLVLNLRSIQLIPAAAAAAAATAAATAAAAPFISLSLPPDGFKELSVGSGEACNNRTIESALIAAATE